MRKSTVLLNSIAVVVAMVGLPIAFLGFNPDQIMLSSYKLGVGLWIGAMFLAWLGSGIARAGRFSWIPDGPLLPIVHYIFIAQLFLGLYVYLRSLFNFAIGFIIPISVVDFLLLGVVFHILAAQRSAVGSMLPSTRGMRHAISRAALPALVLLLLTLVIAQRELPRLIMHFSPDPDLHAFWTAQIFRFKTIPYHSFFWGPQGFGYPAGFAVMNFIWSSVSELNPLNIVAAQPMLQIQLGMLLLFERFGPASRLFPETKPRGYLLSALGLFVIYYVLIPEGYQTSRYNLEGTGRLASLSGFAFAISMLVVLLGTIKRRESTFSMPSFFFFLTLNTAFAIVINPVNGAILGGLFVSCLVIALIQAPFRKILYAGIIGGMGLLPLVCEPTHVNSWLSFSSVEEGVVLEHQNSTEQKDFSIIGLAFASDGLSRITNYFINPATIKGLFHIDTLQSFPVLLLLGMMLLLVLAMLLVQKKINAAQIVIAVIVVMTCTFIVSTSCADTLRFLSPGFYSETLVVYLQAARNQITFLMLVSMVIVALGSVSTMKMSAVYLVSIIAGVFVGRQVGESNKIFAFYTNDMARRIVFSPAGSANGVVTSNDIQVFEVAEQMFAKYKERHPSNLTFEQVEKFLIPNNPVVLDNGERWLFQHGASRVLALRNTFPVAFYYMAGSFMFDHDNYVEHVVNTFDESWLRQRNIRYLFLPDDRGGVPPAVIARMAAIEATKKVIVRKGNALIVDMWELQ